uniref:Cupin-like domain-containing protein n=1 Tax=Amphimedon queenslandica TaxID=400682 RepID=A0A1X7UX20_AMPQE
MFLRKRRIKYTTINTVPVISFPDQEAPFAGAAIKNGEPLIIRNSIINKWRARKLWSPQYLRSKLERLDGVYENNNPWFGPYYDTRKPLLPYVKRLNPYKTNVSLSGQEFFRRLENPSPGGYHYLTSDIDQLGEWAFGDVEPIDELFSPNLSRSSINVWIEQPNVIAHTHYDGYHNFYAQLHRTKKFTLLRPTQWPAWLVS